MGIQESINSALGTASSIAGKLAPSPEQEKVNKAVVPKKTRTADFKNFDVETGKKSEAKLKQEIKGKTAQKERVKKRIATVINTDARTSFKEVL